ncbi:alpha/beta-Hydrolases superfamily protein [Rhynchospora pubera]|uniref:Alpha/beta-Hydrolases superfamily protein n=1 Tax=Rhynchospora pubera TaxID=906938 RepID=A0AAV8DLU9_9POAL|nr:alpha/beta-Hydrolases superfamily protein [Rhynchospora pubera]KAJ4796881.1 alpha/beta-Hydrolases superfamily protein [Rhynchospora pubera]
MERIDLTTSGASGRIIPLVGKVRRSVPSRAAIVRLFVFLQSILLWFFLVLRRTSRLAHFSKSSSPPPPGERRRLAKAEEEDSRRRRELAEAVEMVGPASWCRCGTFDFVGPRKSSLFCRYWVPVSGQMRGILVLIHGLNEHSGRYAHFAEQLTSCYFGVYAMDWIGHGGSDGLHGYVPSLNYVVEDTGAFVERVSSENPGVPCFLLGHSTGGAAVLKASLYPHIHSMLEGIILTSPALRVKPAHPIVGAVAPIFSLVAPRYQFKGANKRGIPVSRDPAAMLAKYSDPLVYTGPIRVRTGHEILRITSFLMQNLRSVTIPFIVLHGTADRVTDPLASQDLYNEAVSVHKDIRLYDGFLHDLLFEPERDDIGADIIAWMDRILEKEIN